MSAKNLIAVILTGTVCAVILTFVVASAFYPPNTISETSRMEVWKLLTFILGVVSGYLGKADPPKTEEPKPPI